jgi:hypothetical protein
VDEKHPTIDQIRARIDAGQMGDKTPASDPAAAPLGTDEEAAGTPPTSAQLRLEQGHSQARPRHSGHDALNHRRAYLAALVIVGGLLLLFLLVAAWQM